MKKILFVSRTMGTGGIERALLNQLYNLEPYKYKIDLMLFNPCGVYMREIPSYVHVLKSNWLLRCTALSQAETKSHAVQFLCRGFFAVCAKIFGSEKVYKVIFRTIKTLGEYDFAISYQNNIGDKTLYFGCNMFVLNKVIANRKIAWVHADYSGLGLNTVISDKEYKKFDAVVQVSQTMKEKFERLNIIPVSKSFVVYNRIPVDMILAASAEDIEIERVKFTIVTVCRMDKLKSVYELCKVAKWLKHENCKFVWYFLGNGPEYKRCKEYVKNNNLQENVMLMGEIANPYPYIKEADLLVSGSVIETFGLSILEAMILKTPVAAIRYEAIDEIICSGENGVVAEDFEGLMREIKKCILDSVYYNKRKKHTVLHCDYNRLNQEQFMDMLCTLEHENDV